MTSDDFVKLIKSRANERVQSKIKVFQESLYNLCNALGIGDGYYSDTAKKVLLLFTKDKLSNKDWPKELWEEQEEKVKEEILGIFDELQKAKLSLDREPNPDDVLPEA